MNRLPLTAIAMLSLCGSAWAQTPERPAPAPAPANYPVVTFGVVSFLGYSAELHESDGYNAFDITRGYFNVQARLNDRVRVRFTPDVRPITDASLDRNLALRLEYASLDAQVTDNVWVMFGLHETPWLTFEESLNRYRVLGPMFSERLGLIPGATDLGASLRATRGRTELHVGVYNGEGYGRAEVDGYKSMDGRATFRPFAEDDFAGNVTISGFYQYRLVRKRSAAQRGHRDGQLRKHPRGRDGAVSVGHRQPVHRQGRRAARPVVLRRGPSGPHRLGRSGRRGLLRPGCVQQRRLETPLCLRRRALESGRTRAFRHRGDARAGVSNGQLPAALAPAAGPDAHRVLKAGSFASP